MRILGLAGITSALVLAGALAGGTSSADEAKPGAGRWILDLKHGPLNTVAWADARGTTTAYHYMTLKVTNNTAFAREWRPMVRAIVDTKPDAPYYALPLVEALDAVRKQEKDAALPLLSETIGKIEPGQTISCVAIFGRLDPMYDRVHVQVHGLVSSVAVFKVEKYPGDRTIIVDAAYYDRNQQVLEALRKEAREAGSDRLPTPESEVQELLERRFWDIQYLRRGDEFQAEDSMIHFVREGWRLDGEPKLLRVIVPAGGVQSK
jgi:hypothetical protein